MTQHDFAPGSDEDQEVGGKRADGAREVGVVDLELAALRGADVLENQLRVRAKERDVGFVVQRGHR
ncbi:MAG: hypothetical protein HYV07_03105 [Deltaproteobacteria bacterium]|nr:hypothetical protein [Deltaproteobacteria bacterium]